MRPELFTLPIFGHRFPVYSYGIMLVLAILASAQLGKFLARRRGVDTHLLIDAGILALLSGLVGARISHILENWSIYTNPHLTHGQQLLNMINLREGGLTYYGGFLLATPALILYARIKKVPLRIGLDIVAPCVVLGLGIGRIGCFLNGCCYGEMCNLPWPMSVQFPYYSNAYIEQYQDGWIGARSIPAQLLKQPEIGPVELKAPHELSGEEKQIAARVRAFPVHPTELYSAFTAFLLCGLLVSYFMLRPAPGRVFALMLILEGASRYVLELIRVEEPILRQWFGSLLSVSMAWGIIMAAAGAILFLALAPPAPPANSGLSAAPARL